MTSKNRVLFYLIVYLWMGLISVLHPSSVLCARLAGEEDVTSTSDKQPPQAQETASPQKIKKPVSQQEQDTSVNRTPVKSVPQDSESNKPRTQPIPQNDTNDKVKANTGQGNPVAVNQSREGKTSDETRYVTIDFDDVDINLFIKFISELTGKNFIIDKAIKGNVTIISPTKITVDEAYRVFESVLEINGFATVKAGSVTKIIPALEARSKDIETLFRKEIPNREDKIVTQLIPLKYADPDEIKKVFGPFVSKTSVMVSYAPTGMLIITDVSSNIKRLLNIIEAIDVEGIGEEITVISLEHATASILAKSLGTIFQQRRTIKGQTKTESVIESAVKVIPDERTNSLILLASENDSAKIKAVIKLLDQETPRGEGDIHVYYLQNANADDLTSVLMAIPSKTTTQEAQQGKAPVVSKDVQIVADKATNTLVITAKKADYLILEDVIKKLDIPRPMVYIEALIMEVSLTKDFNIGVEWQAMDQVGTRTVKGQELAIGAFAGSRPGVTNLPTVNDAGMAVLPSGFTLGVLGDSISISGIKFPTIAAVINAFQSDSDVNILSTPQIMTIDNAEAEIVVAENIPFLTRQDTTSTGDINYSNYEYKDVGVTLNITPQINQERFVRLKISQEVSQVLGQQAIGLPTTLKRQAKTTVIVKDGNTIVIGGLIDETLNRSKSQVPCLGDIVGLGWLFSSRYDASNRKNLFIFLTPHIVENPTEAQKVYGEKKEEIEWEREASIKLYEGRGRYKEDMRLNDRGYSYFLAKDYVKAKEYYERALEINPENPYAIFNMGVLYERQGNVQEAIRMYEKVIALNPKDKAGVSAEAMQKGRSLVDIAKDNMMRLKKENPQ